jgi:hypothetical protein
MKLPENNNHFKRSIDCKIVAHNGHKDRYDKTEVTLGQAL